MCSPNSPASKVSVIKRSNLAESLSDVERRGRTQILSLQLLFANGGFIKNKTSRRWSKQFETDVKNMIKLLRISML